MASQFDDELWMLVPEDAGPPDTELVAFVRTLPAADRTLDLGCGDGRLSAMIETGELTVADVSPVALARARRRLPSATVVELTPDAPLPFEDSSFDRVLCAETLEHVRDTQMLLSEVRRVLRPGGELAVTTPAHGRSTAMAVLARGFESQFDPFSPHLRFYTRGSLRAALDGLGFEVSELRRSGATLLARAVR